MILKQREFHIEHSFEEDRFYYILLERHYDFDDPTGTKTYLETYILTENGWDKTEENTIYPRTKLPKMDGRDAFFQNVRQREFEAFKQEVRELLKPEFDLEQIMLENLRQNSI